MKVLILYAFSWVESKPLDISFLIYKIRNVVKNVCRVERRRKSMENVCIK